ncbi:MAG: hypothetical protein WBI82_07190 [Sphaerochaeta sp.]
MRMVIPYQISIKQRKKLAEDIADALHTLPRYMMYPTCNYEIGGCLLDKRGNLSIPESMDDATVNKLLEHLKNCGYVSEGIEENDKLTINLPRTDFTDSQLDVLKQMVKAKEGLFKRAFRTDSLEVVVTSEWVSFPWFSLSGEADEAQAYATFISKLCEMARKQKRVLASSSDGDNDKYAFRCYLLRLGFIGNEHKCSRAILLGNLAGNSAFRHPKG